MGWEGGSGKLSYIATQVEAGMMGKTRQAERVPGRGSCMDGDFKE